jgi:hypothetical protein
MNNPLISQDAEVPKLVLTKLSLSSTSSDVQVRNSSLQIFSSLLSDYGHLYSEQLWIESLQSLFFRMFDDILEIYLNLRLQQGLDTNVSSPEAVSNLKSLFDEQKLKSKRYLNSSDLSDSPENMIHHHTGEKLDNQWEETFINLIQAYAKIAKKYLIKFGGSIAESGHKEISKKIFDYLYFVLKLNSREIFIEAIKAFKTILSSEVPNSLTESDGLLSEQKALNNIFEQILKNLSKEDKEAEMSKVKQTVIPEVFMMLDQFIDLPKLLVVDCNSDYFFKIFFKLLVYPAINFQDKFKVFLEERYISLIIKKLPNSLRLNGPYFITHFTKTAEKILLLEPENSMINVITNNFVAKLSEVLTNCKGLGIKFNTDLAGAYQGLKKLASRIHDTNYVTQVKNSKNYKDMVWYSAILCQMPLIEILVSDELREPALILELINDLIKASEGLRTSEICTYSMIKADCLKEFTLFILTHPKLLQKTIILASQLEQPVEESLLVAAMGEISLFEEYLQNKIFKSYQFDLESKNTVTKYNKNLLETNHRIMAAISSDDEKSSEAYYNLVVRYNKGFEEVIKHSIKSVTKLDEYFPR